MTQEERKKLEGLVVKYGVACYDFARSTTVSDHREIGDEAKALRAEIFARLATFTEDEVRIEGFCVGLLFTENAGEYDALALDYSEEVNAFLPFDGKIGTLTFTPDKEKL